ncbi:hypothetical protein [Pseudomonas marginalis]|uniref:hypothetical protein n=1 Tax=Pseudomonas marginalis TaxID=298 RepID=UPI002480EC85|nr:hypothetical protein [Pseudomonas marginalis]WGT26639.1 hypothetical protein QGQ83_23640 [Pseudomonas marginalis]
MNVSLYAACELLREPLKTPEAHPPAVANVNDFARVGALDGRTLSPVDGSHWQ